MKMLHQHPDGTIWVRADGDHYGETPEVFAQDYGKEFPKLPQGITERIYEPGVRHALLCGTDVVDGGPLPWPEGDQVIAKSDLLISKHKQRAQEARDKAENELNRITAAATSELKR
jgi:hypothetical protein